MNLSDIAKLATKPVGALSSVMNTPNSAGRYRPFYFHNMQDALAGKTLKDAVKGKVVLITGASSGIGEGTARQIGAAGGEAVLVARTWENLERVANDIRADGEETLVDRLDHIRTRLGENVGAVFAPTIIGLYIQVVLEDARAHRAIKHQHTLGQFAQEPAAHWASPESRSIRSAAEPPDRVMYIYPIIRMNG